MAAIERGAGADDAVVRGWLAKALTAPRGPQWVCDNCQHIEGHWAPVCSNCGAFDTLSWREPPVSEVALPAGTAMLPLIVGQIADRRGNAAEPPGEEVPKPPAEDRGAVPEDQVVEAEVVGDTSRPAEPTTETERA
jgi:HemY protein